MIDPLLTLSFYLHAQKGAYALLLGSGISRSASIPTGWEVTLDLISKLAHLQQEECEGNEVDWYLKKFGKEPDYSELLSAIAPTSAAQQQLLKQYFEPSADERDEGKKLPTAAHKAIAKLVATGHIRVIVTTNFDRLIESALEAEGITPIVIASPDAAKGAPPLVHSHCTVIKVHGDYLDQRIKNSSQALAKYAPTLNRLLDQVFDEYGLIVCGWSAEYDVALRGALERGKARRYQMYWAGRLEPQGHAKELIALHNADVIKIESADNFFTTLLEKVQALDEFDRPHPITVQAAVITLKRYLSEEKYRIQLRDFLVSETERARPVVDTAFSNLGGVAPNQQSASDLMQRLEAGCEILVQLFSNGSFFAGSDQVRPFFEAFHLVAANVGSGTGYEAWSLLRRYPALLLIYAAGLSAVVSQNYSVLSEIASKRIHAQDHRNDSAAAPVYFYTHNIMRKDAARQLLEGMDRRHTPVSDYLADKLREPLHPLIPDDTQFIRVFDDFEYLWCLLHVDAELQRKDGHVWTPYGAFSWRKRESDSDWFGTEARTAVENKDKSWAPVRAGLFGGSIERLGATLEVAEPILAEISRSLW